MVSVEVNVDGAWREIHMKLERYNSTGSSKDRTARFMIADIERKGQLIKGAKLIESTSGNLGVALAKLCQSKGLGFVAVIDPKATPENLKRMRSFAAEIELVDEYDETGGYLLSRLRHLTSLLKKHANLIWTNQYRNPVNPEAHYGTTGPEVYHDMQGAIDVVFAPVSTGGTLAGVGRYFREISPHTKIVAVDAMGSVIFGGRPGKRLLNGIGSSQTSHFINAATYDSYFQISDIEAFQFCLAVRTQTAVGLGGSGGAAIAAAVRYLNDNKSHLRVVCICPDGSENYESTIYNNEWLLANGCEMATRFNRLRFRPSSTANI